MNPTIFIAQEAPENARTGAQRTTVSTAARAWLAHFPSTRRSAIANLFHYGVRAGAATPAAVIAWVRQDVHRRLRGYPDPAYDAPFEAVLAALQADLSGALAYAQAVIDWEQLPYAERQRQKADRASQYQHAYMATQPPTERQLAFLCSLGYHGPQPADRLAASHAIDALLRDTLGNRRARP
jgi:hypothetical protein